MLQKVDRLKKVGSVTTEIVTVTPDIAAQWLTTNVNNRVIAKRFVSQYARDMKSKAWELTGDSIKFNERAELIDGQHRLQACVTSGVAFRTFVVYGLPENARNVVDTGKARSIGDVLQMAGVPHAKNVASTLKLLINQKRGLENQGGNATVTHSELVAAYERHQSLPLYVFNPKEFPRGISIPSLSYLHYVSVHILGNKDRAEAMRSVLKTGVPDYAGDPIHKWRERIIGSRVDVAFAPHTRVAMFWTLKHAWNLFAKRVPIEMLRYRSSDVPIEGLDLTKL